MEENPIFIVIIICTSEVGCSFWHTNRVKAFRVNCSNVDYLEELSKYLERDV